MELTGALACDVLDFRTAVEHDPVRAVGFHVPRFFEGASLRRAPQFDEWVSTTRGDLLRLYHQVLGRLAREAMGQGRWREATELADRWLLSEPVSDEAAHLAVEARYLSGNRAGALARFAEYRDLLAREAGCEPGRSLQALVRRVEADRTASDAPPITDEWFTRAPTFEASLVGRDAHWKALTAAWKGVLRGHGRIVLIDGESGVGKSRLADEFLRWVVAEGGTALRGRSYDRRAGTPFEPVVEALRCALTAPGLGRHLARLAGRGGAPRARAARAVPGHTLRRRASGGGKLAPVRGRGAAVGDHRRRTPPRGRHRRLAMVRRGQLQPDPFPHPPAGALAGALARGC